MELEMGIEDLLNKRKIESDRVEFKRGWNPDDIYHSVCAFANDYKEDKNHFKRICKHTKRRKNELLVCM